MNGFETGLLVRTQNAENLQATCKTPEISKGAKLAMDTIKSGLLGAKNAVDLNETITEAIDMVLDFMQTLTAIMAILDPAEPGQLDEYCAGYVYGLEGSKVMVTLANRVINHKDKDGKIKSTLDP